MRRGYKQRSLQERWAMDTESYKNGAKRLVSTPQCTTCENYIKGNALHCKCYASEQKPKYVMFPERECPSYCSHAPMVLDIKNEKESRIYGGLFGFCVGDAMGVPVEFSTREERKRNPVEGMWAYGTHHQPFGTWSDDTSLTLCLIDAINKGYSVNRLAQNFVDFYEKSSFTPWGEIFDIGNATRDALIQMCAGKNPVECGGAEENHNENGSLMRVLPLAFYAYKLGDDDLIKMVEEVSSLTHRTKRSKLACIFYVQFVIQLLENEKEHALEKTVDFVKKNCRISYADELQYFARILDKQILSLPEEQVKSTGYVVDTLEAAVWTFFHTTGYREAILKAVNLGGDTDTIAAVAGGMAGAYYGFCDIPDNWIQNIVKKEELYWMFQDFGNCCNIVKG
ncbi:MAG: ADP-ribosylglycohydrolase family protein [Lachnospiraceae bacterium]|nr:ADP-ribosylglycohydrolase family protein [Lachnospiraceae bacterium]